MCFPEIVDELDNLQEALSSFRTEQEDGEEVSLHPFEVSALMNLVIADTSKLQQYLCVWVCVRGVGMCDTLSKQEKSLLCIATLSVRCVSLAKYIFLFFLLYSPSLAVEEAQALIPSLTRFGESATDEILELIKGAMLRIVS
jgi:hypothetical protein